MHIDLINAHLVLAMLHVHCKRHGCVKLHAMFNIKRNHTHTRHTKHRTHALHNPILTTWIWLSLHNTIICIYESTYKMCVNCLISCSMLFTHTASNLFSVIVEQVRDKVVTVGSSGWELGLVMRQSRNHHRSLCIKVQKLCSWPTCHS